MKISFYLSDTLQNLFNFNGEIEAFPCSYKSKKNRQTCKQYCENG